MGVVVRVNSKEDLAAAERLASTEEVVVMDCDASGWKVIPAENLVAAFQQSAAKLIGTATSAADARVMLEGARVDWGRG